METIQTKIKKEIINLIKKAGIVAEIEDIAVPPQEEMGDFSFACFKAAKQVKKDPVKIAQDIAEKIKAGLDFFEKVEAAGPYVNFFVKANAVAKLAVETIAREKEKFGQNEIGAKKKIMVEFSQPNTHKEFHIGHSRGTLLGQSLVNILQASGYKVISANYFNDTGAHVAKWLWAYTKFHEGEEPKKNVGAFMNQVYQEANVKIAENEEYKKEVSEIKQKLEQGDKEILKLWKKTRQWSIDQFEKIYNTLNIDFDVYFYESDEEEAGKKLVNELLEKGIARKSEGAVIVDLEKYDLGVFLILKSDGTSLYSTHDLPLAEKKFKKYKIDKSLYVVDVRQTMYFKQLFKTLELMGFDESMRHIDYEFVSTPEGVISSRRGEVPTFMNLYNYVLEMAGASTKERHPDWPENKISTAAEKITLSAIKYEMLKSSRGREIIIDPKKALSFEGFTGPYLLYTVARINSIIKKERPGKIKNWDTLNPALLEKQLILQMLEFPEAVVEAAGSSQPSVVAQYLFELAQKFAEFYHEIHVLKAEEPLRSWRLSLICSVKQVLENGLNLLGIDYLEEM